MNADLQEWRIKLTKVVTAALEEFRSTAVEEMAAFAVDLHPWNGLIILAFLTQSETLSAPSLSDPAEMAAWKYYDFAADRRSWEAAAELADEMRAAYDRAGDRRSQVAHEFFTACATAIRAKPVQDSLADYRLASGFKITVAHPDNGKEYYV